MSTYKHLSRRKKRQLEEPLDMVSGYVLDFSNRTIEEYFGDEFGIEFYSERYAAHGESKAKRLRAIWEISPDVEVARVLRGLWNYRSTLPPLYKGKSPEDEERLKDNYFSVVLEIESSGGAPMPPRLTKFEKSDTLDELINSIERSIRADKPQAALDHLHTYCQKKFRFLVEQNGGSIEKDDPLNSRVGKYCKQLESQGVLQPMSIQIIKNSISVFEKFNSIRNDHSLAHDNQILGHQEARFIFDSVSAVLRFIKASDTNAFGS